MLCDVFARVLVRACCAALADFVGVGLQIFVELERARLTRQLSAIHESEGNVDKASEILQEVAVRLRLFP